MYRGRENGQLLEYRAKKTGGIVGPELGVIGDGFATTATADPFLRRAASSVASVVVRESQGTTLMDLRLMQREREQRSGGVLLRRRQRRRR